MIMMAKLQRNAPVFKPESRETVGRKPESAIICRKPRRRGLRFRPRPRAMVAHSLMDRRSPSK